MVGTVVPRGFVMRPTVEWAWRPGACAVRRPCCSSPPPQIELNCLGCQRQFREACHVGFVELLFGQHLVSPLALCNVPFLDRRSNMARPIRTADGHSPAHQLRRRSRMGVMGQQRPAENDGPGGSHVYCIKAIQINPHTARKATARQSTLIGSPRPEVRPSGSFFI